MVEGSGLENLAGNSRESGENAQIGHICGAPDAMFAEGSDDCDGPYVGTDHLYFIQDESGPIKIGRGKDPAARLRNLQIGNPRKLTLIGSIPDNGYMEPFWHVCFEYEAMMGEWFEGSECLVAAITTALSGGYWTDHVPMIHPNADDEGEWQEHLFDALEVYQEYACDKFLYIKAKRAAELAIFDDDFDGRSLGSRFADGMAALESAGQVHLFGKTLQATKEPTE